ncbi:MAG: hypothetical protein A2Y02_02965 [Omnitrophica bacterium GWA2_52_12]|nr:MAG: hypothetical protein A2Y02_02965 [Omnitrophica bacterium GWA2_52_12]
MSLLMDTLEKAQRDAAKARPVSLTPAVSTAPFVAPAKPAVIYKPDRPEQRLADASKETAVVSLTALVVGICVAAFAAVGIRSLNQTPAFLSAMPREVSAKAGVSAVPNLPVLQGIVRNGSSAFCLISGQIYRPGDLWQEYLVQSVNDGAVVFLHPDGKTFTLRLKS